MSGWTKLKEGKNTKSKTEPEQSFEYNSVLTCIQNLKKSLKLQEE